MQSSLDQLQAEVCSCAAAMLGQPVTEIEGVEGGANNRVFRVRAGRLDYALKLYPATAGDTRDRLGAETAALGFMNRHGLRTVPALVAADRASRIGLYEWIEGEPVDTATDDDIAAVLRLLMTLHALKTSEAATDLQPASEACLSGAELVAQIERRLIRLEQVAAELPVLAGLLKSGIVPAFGEARARAVRLYTEAGLTFAAPIELAHRTLSPSDFGFHNARRRRDGSLCFYDFEYFGWDDPVKPISDFVLHPGMSITDPQRRQFVAGALDIYGAEKLYGLRLRALFPLFGLRWCLILLNEFLPERWARRVQAGAVFNRATAFSQQLAKAETMLAVVNKSIAQFPYDG